MQVEAWLARAARTAPAEIAVQTPDGRLDYAGLLAAATSAVDELAARGARRGEQVAIALPAGADFAVALHACMLLGAVAVPVDLRLTAVERERVAGRASVLVDGPLVAGILASSVGGVPSPSAPSPSAPSPSVPSPGVPSPEDGLGANILPHENNPPSATTPATTFPATTPPWRSPAEPPAAFDGTAATHDLDDVCAVIYTSGTTACARAVELTYGNFLWSAIGSGVALGVDSHERWLCVLPLAHVGGLSILVRSAIYATTAVVHERFETEPVLAALREQRITLVSLVSTTLARLLDAGLREPPSLRHALTGGGPVPDSLIRRARGVGVPVTPTYGLTEACSQVSTGGPPLFCTRVRIDATGEIVLAGPTVAPGALGADGWLHTGDLGGLDADGALSVSGRAAETIVSGGENVAPSEVEAVLEMHPDVLEAAVVGREDEQWGEAVSAIVVLRDRDAQPEGVTRLGPRLPASPPAGVIEAELRAHCAARLAPFKVPKRVSVSTAPLPRTRSGKLLRREL